MRVDDHRKLEFVVLGWRFVWSRSRVRPLRVSTRSRGPIKVSLSPRGASSLEETFFNGWCPPFESTLDCAWEEEEEGWRSEKDQSPCSLLSFPCVGRRKGGGGGRQGLLLFFSLLADEPKKKVEGGSRNKEDERKNYLKGLAFWSL